MRRMLLVLVAAVIAASLAYAVAPPRSAVAYSERASSTLELLRSQAQTARLWINAVDSGQVTQPAARIAFTETEQDARAQTSAFAAHDPPEPLAVTEPVRDEVTSAGERTVSVLGRVRVAAATGQWQRLPELEAELDQLQQQLERQAAEVAR